MSLLTICQNAINSIPLNAPTVIYGNTNETAKLALTCANQAGKALMKRHGWTVLQRERTFTTVADQVDYSLPSGFDRIIDQTVWDRSNYTNTRGGMSPAQWQEYKSSVLSSTVTTWKRYRMRYVTGAKHMSLFPTPDSADSMVFEYVSSQFCETAGGTGQDAWGADDDTGVIDEWLIELGVKWRMLNRLGMAYDEEKEEYDREVALAIGRDGGAPVFDVHGRQPYRLIGAHNVPDTGYGV